MISRIVAIAIIGSILLLGLSMTRKEGFYGGHSGGGHGGGGHGGGGHSGGGHSGGGRGYNSGYSTGGGGWYGGWWPYGEWYGGGWPYGWWPSREWWRYNQMTDCNLTGCPHGATCIHPEWGMPFCGYISAQR